MKKHYCDYFKVDEHYTPCMDKAQINASPDKWLAFYPHETFVKLLQTILKNLAGGNKSVWLTGPYGTGKSHAALVLQKLFMDDEKRVRQWLEKRKALIPEAVAQALFAQRAQKVFVVFDEKSDNIQNPNVLLARMENTTIRALQDAKAKIPSFGSVKDILERVKQEGEFFFASRDKIQARLGHLTSDITSFSQLEKRMQNPGTLAGMLNDITLVLQERSIYMNLTSENFLAWINDICKANGFAKFIFVWDEFSEYINTNKNQLTTFQALAQASQSGQFFFIPVTHTHLEAYQGTGADNATKVGNRFDFIALDMPTNTALQLAADALLPVDGDWEKDRAMLWNSVTPLIKGYMAARDEDCKRYPDSFQGVLPLHPMAAFLLKFLSTTIGANQRSMFSFLQSQSGDSEFQQFIQVGGPQISGRQFLTVDYLWHYFIEREDLGLAKEVFEVRIEFANKSQSLSADEKRVFKAVLLYSLLGRMTSQNGNELVLPTVDNICRCFDGDGNIIVNLAVLKELEKKHCFSIINNRCEMFHALGNTADLDKKKEAIQNDFHNLILQQVTQPRLESQIKKLKDKLHFEVRVATPDKAGMTCQAKKEVFGDGNNKILLQFIVARDEKEQDKCYGTAIELSKRWKDFRMLFVVCPEIYFNSYKKDNWEDYVDQVARRELAPDTMSKKNYETQMNLIEDEWCRKLVRPDQKLQIVRPNLLSNGEPFTEAYSWATLENFVKGYLKECFTNFVDDLSDYNTTAMTQSGMNYRGWALAALDSTTARGTFKNIITAFAKRSIENTPTWFAANPSHPLTVLKELCKSKLNNALSSSTGNCSLVRIFADLKCPPFGLLDVGFSAFVMGFVMKDWLENARQQLQWTDGVDSQPLDAATLADMIAVAVKDNGESITRNEKKICRMSKEEKKFIECAPEMFGIPHTPNATVELTLNNIAARLEKISGKVPLWVLPEYIEKQNEIQFENLHAIINALCDAEKISKDGDVQKRREHVKEIGKRLLETEGLSMLVAKYVNTETLNQAFQQSVDQKKPSLASLANEIGDTSNYYCQAIKDHLAATSSWLWNSQNLDAELDILEAQYRGIQVIQKVSDKRSFMRYEEALELLKNAMEKTNRFSLETLGNEYPALNQLPRLLDAQKAGDGYLHLAEFLVTNKELLKELFFDPACTVQLQLLRKLFAKQLAALSDAEVSVVYEQLSVGSLRSDADFKKTVLLEIEDYQKKSAAKKLEKLWQQKTESASPQAWSDAHSMPVAVLFEQLELVHEIIPVLDNPGAYQANVIEGTITKLDAARLTPQGKLAGKFLKLVLPEKYLEIGIAAEKLTDFLKAHLNADPEKWMANNAALHSAIDRFVREHYATTIRSEVVAKAKGLSDAEAKRMLLALLENTPEAGLDFLNL